MTDAAVAVTLNLPHLPTEVDNNKPALLVT